MLKRIYKIKQIIYNNSSEVNKMSEKTIKITAIIMLLATIAGFISALFYM